jgi:hypothetical protein
MKVYDKDGKEYEVRHAIDAKEWVASGNYFFENPKETKKKDK